MKRVLILVLLLTGFVFAQNTDKQPVPPAQTQSQLHKVIENTTEVLRVKVVEGALPSGGATSSNQTSGAQKTQVVDGSGNVIGATANAMDVNIKSSTTLNVVPAQALGVAAYTGNLTLTAGVSALQLSATTATSKFVDIMHYTDGAILYVGSSGVTTSTGNYALQKGDVLRLPVDDRNKIYVISTVAGTDVRYSYGN